MMRNSEQTFQLLADGLASAFATAPEQPDLLKRWLRGFVDGCLGRPYHPDGIEYPGGFVLIFESPDPYRSGYFQGLSARMPRN